MTYTKSSRRPGTGVICIPFSDDETTLKDQALLKRILALVVEAGRANDLELGEIRGDYSTATAVIDRIYRRIQDAELVVVVALEPNPNVFFEAGYATGWNKPVLYITRKDAPFNIRPNERVIYSDATTVEVLANAIKKCLENERGKLTAGADFVQVRQRLQELKLEQDLFGRALGHTLRNLGEWVLSCNNNSVEFAGTQNILEVGTYILDSLKSDGFATQYYSGQASWKADDDFSTRDEYFEATRQAVRRDCAITRVYVLDTAIQANEATFRELVWADVAAGIDVKYVLLSELPNNASRDFAIWDDELLAEVDYTREAQPRLARARYKNSTFDLGNARIWKRRILERAKPVFDFPNEEALLERSIADSTEILSEHCHSNDRGKTDCSDYHLPWRILRGCRMVSTPSWHADFYSNAFRSWAARAKQEPARNFDVLISGLADHGMLYWTAQCIEHSVRMRCTFHVLDICSTPLWHCEWLQGALENRSPPLHLKLRVLPRDILDNDLAAESFDMIVSDAFLSRFHDDDAKRKVMREWCRLLREDGTIVTTVRVKRDTTDPKRDGEIRKVDRSSFVERARKQAFAAGKDTNVVAARASAYSEKITSYPFESLEALGCFLAEFEGPARRARIDDKALDQYEMAPAYYGRIEMGPEPAKS